MSRDQFSGIAAALNVPDIDTDTIIPIDYCINRERPDFDVALFRTWRFDNDGNERPEFLLNTTPFRNTEILITGANFGCGSSREMAVWALADFGIRCVIAPSFGEIFYNNCFQNDVLAARVSADTAVQLSKLVDRTIGMVLSVDLKEKTIRAPQAGTFNFDLDSLRCDMLLAGLDPVAATLTRIADIEAFERKDHGLRPWLRPTGA